jgi:two-component system, LytTR family, sensor kinase
MHGWFVHASVGKQLLLSAETEFCLLPFKLVVAYFAMYAFLPSLLSDKKQFLPALLKMIGVLTITVIVYRLACYYYTNPVIYGIVQNHWPLFSVMDCWMALLDIVPIAAIAVVIKFVRIRMQSKEKERNLVKAKLETELKFLRNQTNPHFLFNTLTSIHTLACKNSDDTPEVIMKLSKLLNFTLYESRKAVIVVGDELQMLDKYIELESIRFDGKRDIAFISEIDNEYEQIAPLLLLSLVQHAFMRGNDNSGVERSIQIDIKLQSGLLNVQIEKSRDGSGEGTSEDTVDLANIRRRIDLLYRDYELVVEDGKELFKAALAVNLHSHAEI